MSRKNTRSLLGRATAVAIGVLAILASALAVTGITAAPAQADHVAEERYGYAKVQTPEPYLADYVAQNGKVLFVDTEHATADGFWFATKSYFHPLREFGWVYQPYGLWCDFPTGDVEFNPWMNTHTCLVNGEKVTAAGYPDYVPNTAACRERTGYPWKAGSPFPNQQSVCADTPLDRASTGPTTEGFHGYTCAPWEDQGLTPSGGPKCVQTTYPWVNGPVNTFWMSAPDTCTQMPANSNRVYYNPTDYAPVTGGDGSCTGEALAPNCPTGSIHEACTGVPAVWETASRSATVTGVSATKSVERSATQRVVRAKVTRSATKFYRGKKFTASATQGIRKSATRSATRSVTVTDGSATRTATRSCGAVSAEEAQVCAADKALAEANRAATAAAVADASSRATPAAVEQARTASIAAALAAANQVKVTRSDKRKAGAIAKSKAVRKVERLIAQYKNR